MLRLLWGKRSAWTSTEIGGDLIALFIFGQKPIPTFILKGDDGLRTQTETITIRLTPDEKQLLEELKQKSDSPSMRKFILDMCVTGKVVVNSDLREANKELRYQGNNLNQLTRLCHQGEIKVVNLDTLLTSYRRILLAIGGDANGDRK